MQKLLLLSGVKDLNYNCTIGSSFRKVSNAELERKIIFIHKTTKENVFYERDCMKKIISNNVCNFNISNVSYNNPMGITSF